MLLIPPLFFRKKGCKVIHPFLFLENIVVRFLMMFMLLVSLFAPAHAALNSDSVAQAGFNKLTEQQKADILKQVADASAKSEVSTVVAGVTPTKVDEWVTLGERIGKIMGGAAREVGIAVNDFVKTPVGQLTMFLIVWKVMGGMLIHLAGGLIVFASGWTFTYILYRRLSDIRVVYHPEAKDWLGRPKVVKVTKESLTSDAAWGLFGSFMVTTVIGLIVIFTF